MNKILISGYYGFNNIGDESILLAVVENLRARLDDIEITVLSENPGQTAEKYSVRSASRRSITAIIREVRRTDILISGGGSLLQDVTSRKSIIYYLSIMELAWLFGKKFFVYSQGIGPINGKLNRKLTARVLRNASGIAVRDRTSKDLLCEIGLDENDITVTADPVLRLKPVPLDVGAEILRSEGFDPDGPGIKVGFAIRERDVHSAFVDELCGSINRLTDEEGARVVLIPFHFSEDTAVIHEIQRRLGDRVHSLEHKYLTNEMLSIIGNMDVLVGVRLHSLIHAAIMDVPMIAVSYDPKVNSFMYSIGRKALCSIYDFNADDFMDAFRDTVANADVIRQRVRERVNEQIQNLDSNEEMLRKYMR